MEDIIKQLEEIQEEMIGCIVSLDQHRIPQGDIDGIIREVNALNHLHTRLDNLVGVLVELHLESKGE